MVLNTFLRSFLHAFVLAGEFRAGRMLLTIPYLFLIRDWSTQNNINDLIGVISTKEKECRSKVSIWLRGGSTGDEPKQRLRERLDIASTKNVQIFVMMYIPNDRVHSKHGLPESVFRPHELYLGKNNTLALHSVFMLVCAYVFRGLVLKDFRYVTYRLRKHCVSSSIRHKICAAEESVSNINKTIIPYTKAIRCSVIEDLYQAEFNWQTCKGLLHSKIKKETDFNPCFSRGHTKRIETTRHLEHKFSMCPNIHLISFVGYRKMATRGRQTRFPRSCASKKFYCQVRNNVQKRQTTGKWYEKETCLL